MSMKSRRHTGEGSIRRDREPKTLEFPPKVRKALEATIACVSEYEDIASIGVDASPEEQKDMVETLVSLGVFNAELAQNVQSLYVLLAEWYTHSVQKIEERNTPEHGAKNEREKRRIEAKIRDAVAQFSGQFEKSIQRLVQQVQDEKPLAGMLIAEAFLTSQSMYLQTLLTAGKQPKADMAELFDPQIQHFKQLEERFRDIAKHTPELHVQDSALSKQFAWGVLANRARHLPIQYPKTSPLNMEDVHAWLHTMQFDTVPEAEIHTVPNFKVEGMPVSIALFFPEDLHPMAIAGFEIRLSGQSIVAGEVSRVTSGLTINGMYCVDTKHMFDAAHSTRLYQQLRYHVLNTLLSKYANEQLDPQERSELYSLLQTASVQRAAVSQPEIPSARNASGEPEPSVNIQPDSKPTSEEQPTPIDTITVQATPTGLKDHLDDSEKPAKKRIEKPKKLSVLEVKRRLLQHVLLDKKRGDHPHFISKDGKVRMRFFNRHTGTERLLNISEIRDMCDTLGITHEEFWAV